VFLEAFEGPLDLLLYLIRRQNLDILDIPIAEVTRQYMDYIADAGVASLVWQGGEPTLAGLDFFRRAVALEVEFAPRGATIGNALLGGDGLDPPIRAICVYNSNPLAIAPDGARVRQGFSREDLFCVVLEHFQTDTADYADILLPATTQLEHLDVHRSYGHLYMLASQPAIAPLGEYNASLFDSSRDIFMTFDPKDEGLPFIGVATGETDQVLINAFGKGVIAACTRNESFPCSARPKVDCDTAAPVIYFATENQTNVLFLDNCIIVSGREKELWKAADRMLFHFLGIQ